MKNFRSSRSSRSHLPFLRTLTAVLLSTAGAIGVSSCSLGSKQEVDQQAGIATPAPEPSPPAPLPPPSHPYPNFIGQEFRGEKNFARLINEYTQGKVEPSPWAGFWWPYTGNGIAAGSFSGGESAAGKYDAARGRATSAQSWEVIHHGAQVPQVQQWWGHCNGWCVAAALFPEPKEPVTVNGITFGIGDIKALLSEAGMSALADFYGERVDIDDSTSPKYWDTIPDQYFLVLTNYIGKLKQAVLIDRYTGSQVWNQPLAGYRFEYPRPSDYLGNTTAAPNVYRILVNSRLWWMDDGVAPDVQSEAFNLEDPDSVPYSTFRDLSMEVWLDGPVVFDSNGKITSSGDVIVTRQGDNLVGGAWRMGEGYEVDAWPDYMWIPYGVTRPSDPDQDYINPEIDIDWIRAHILVPGGADDPTANPAPIEPAPRPSRALPTGIPTFLPTWGPEPGPSSFPTWGPTSGPTSGPGSDPFPPWPNPPRDPFPEWPPERGDGDRFPFPLPRPSR